MTAGTSPTADPVSFMVCNCLIGTRCLRHCPNVLISILNILRKERARIFCGLFRYLLFHRQDLSPQKLVMSDLDGSGKFCLGCCQTFCLISTFSPSWLSCIFSPSGFLTFFVTTSRLINLYPKTLALHIFPGVLFKCCSQ